MKPYRVPPIVESFTTRPPARPIDPIQVILNPAAASGQAARVGHQLRAGLESRGLPYRLQETQCPGHGEELARAVPEGTRALLAVGGDGTVHEIANGLLANPRAPALAVLPVGTGNDFHRMLGSGRDVDGALGLLERREEAHFEVGVVRWPQGERFFVNVLGIGIDAEVLRLRHAFRRLSGLPQYLAALAAALIRYRPITIEIETEDGQLQSTETMLTAVNVGPSAGGGFLLSPDADPCDGQLDLLVVHRLNPFQVARYLPRVVRGTHADLPVVAMRRFRRLSVRAPSGQPFHFELDGELHPEAVTTLDVEVMPHRLRVLRAGEDQP